MKTILLLFTLLTAVVSAGVTNPAIPGAIYNGTEDREVFKMLVFSCFQNCNTKYYESMYVTPITKDQIPEGGSVPSIYRPNGRTIKLIKLTKEPLKKFYMYPHKLDGAEILQFKADFHKIGSVGLTLTLNAIKIDGSYYLLRPVFVRD